MIFRGISRVFSLENDGQYETIGHFWDEMEEIYGIESLQGLGYSWSDGKIYYAIGLKSGMIEGCNFEMSLPDDGWVSVNGHTDNLKMMYDDIYKDGALDLEIEEFNDDGSCNIKYYRKAK